MAPKRQTEQEQAEREAEERAAAAGLTHETATGEETPPAVQPTPTVPNEMTPDGSQFLNPEAAANPDLALEPAPPEGDYVVQHDAVGPWGRGDALRQQDLVGMDVERLLRVGAIRRAADVREEQEG